MWNNRCVSTAPLWHATMEISPVLSRVNRGGKKVLAPFHIKIEIVFSWHPEPASPVWLHLSMIAKKREKTEHKGKLLHLVAKSSEECEWFGRAEKKLEWVSKVERWLMGNSNNLFYKTINTSYIDAVELKSYLTWNKIIQRQNPLLMQWDNLLYFSALCGNISTL